MQLRGVVFDFDLTLADSTLAVVECSNHALSVLGFGPVGTEPVRRTIGLTLPQAFRALTAINDAKLESAYARHFVSRADDVMVAWTRFYEGVPEALESLRRDGLRLGIVSTKFRHRIEAILEKASLSNIVDVVVGSEDVREHKPHPEGLLQALGKVDVAPSQAIYVGDHPLDAETAARAGTAFVAVRTGVSPPDAWTQNMPLGIVDDLGGLRKLLEAKGILPLAM
jgi:phosphoglycolate phosphatase